MVSIDRDILSTICIKKFGRLETYRLIQRVVGDTKKTEKVNVALTLRQMLDDIEADRQECLKRNFQKIDILNQ